MRVALLGSVIFWLAVASLFSGCAQLIGIKSYESGDTKITFTSGWDFGVSANAVDTVNNQRGIQPGEGYKNGQ